MTLRDRIGVDVGRKLPLEDGDRLGGRCIRCALSTCSSIPAPTRSARSMRARGAAMRAGCERHGIHLGLHTASAVNVAEYAPFVGDAVDRYLEAYVDAAVAARRRMDRRACRVSFHLRPRRAHAGRPASGCAASPPTPSDKGALILLENLNKEPDEAEVHYLAHTVEEWRYLFRPRSSSPALRLSFTVNHAHLVPEGIAGFVDALDFARVHEVRLADCWRNGHEVHLQAGRRRSRFRRHVPAGRRSRVPRPLHERVRLARRHAGRPRGSGAPRRGGRHRYRMNPNIG